jgi:alkylhydroperoxidase family enzyme
MAWIEVITESEAEGELAEYYDEIIEPWGGVDNILKIHSLNLPSMRAHQDTYVILMKRKSELSRPQREMIAVATSAANRCHY